MNTTPNGHRSASPTPGFGTIALTAAIFIVPLLLWGDRFPWLVVFPVAIIIALTVRAELHRVRKPVAAPRRVEVALLVTSDVQVIWESTSRVQHEEWVDILHSKNCVNATAPRRNTPPARHEDLLAVA